MTIDFWTSRNETDSQYAQHVIDYIKNLNWGLTTKC